jgi:hypothetical protein
MPYTLRAKLKAILQATETADGTASPASTEAGSQRFYDQYGVELSLSGDSLLSFPTIAGQVIDLSGTLSGTTKDFDLTAAPWAGDVSRTVDKSTKKLAAIIIKTAIGNNAAGLTFGPQGGNGYALWGASKTLILYPGSNFIHFYADPAQASSLTLRTPVIGSGAKDLRWTGTSGDVWKCLALFDG